MAEDTGKLKYKRATSPKGEANFPWLNTIDTKYAANGVYKTQLVMPFAEAKPLIDALETMVNEVYAMELAKRKPAAQKKKALEKGFPYAMVCDEEGEETGDVSFAFKLNAKVDIKAFGDKPAKTLEFKPKFFDAKGTLIEKAPIVYAGSILRINYEPCAYMVEGTSTCGISLRIYGIQVIKLVSSGSNNESAKDMGFGEEDGYTADNFDNNGAGNAPSNDDHGDAGDF